MASPVVAVTAQAAVLSVVSSVLAQVISAWRSETTLALNWLPITEFFLFSVLVTPPNFAWQVFLESAFPGSTALPATEQEKMQPHLLPLAGGSLNWRNTIIKTLLDQSASASINTLVLCLYVGVWDHSITSYAASSAVSAASAALHRVGSDFWPLLVAGWRFWPWVSLGNFALVSDVPTRNLIGSLANVAWGIYIALATTSKKVATE